MSDRIFGVVSKIGSAISTTGIWLVPSLGIQSPLFSLLAVVGLEDGYRQIVQYTNLCVVDWGKIGFRGRKPNGEMVSEKLPYRPFIFVDDDTDGGWRGIHGEKLRRFEFSSIREANKAIRNPGGAQGKLHGVTDWPYQYLKVMYPEGIKYDLGLVRVLYLDIESARQRRIPRPR